MSINYVVTINISNKWCHPQPRTILLLVVITTCLSTIKI
jgi:hypothetical protein